MKLTLDKCNHKRLLIPSSGKRQRLLFIYVTNRRFINVFTYLLSRCIVHGLSFVLHETRYTIIKTTNQ